MQKLFFYTFRLFFATTLTSLSTFANELINDALAADLPFDGSVLDVSGNGLNGIPNGGNFTADRFGSPAAALGLSGPDYLEIPIAQLAWNSNSSMAVSVSFKYLNFNDQYNQLLTLRKECGAFQFSVHSDKMRSKLTFTTGTQCGEFSLGEAAPIESQRWYHLVFIISEGSGMLLLDGQLVGTIAKTHENLEPSDRIVFGWNSELVIDSVRVYDRAIPIAEAVHIYHQDNRTQDNPRGARAEIQVVNGFVVGATLLDGGSGYQEEPATLVSSNQGSGAVIALVMESGRITDLSVESAGSGYSEDATLLIGSPQSIPTISMRPSRYMISMHVTLGRRYQLQSSINSSDWEALGEPFLAYAELIEVEVPIQTPRQFFRVVQLP